MKEEKEEGGGGHQCSTVFSSQHAKICEEHLFDRQVGKNLQLHWQKGLSNDPHYNLLSLFKGGSNIFNGGLNPQPTGKSTTASKRCKYRLVTRPATTCCTTCWECEYEYEYVNYIHVETVNQILFAAGTRSIISKPQCCGLYERAIKSRKEIASLLGFAKRPLFSGTSSLFAYIYMSSAPAMATPWRIISRFELGCIIQAVYISTVY